MSPEESQLRYLQDVIEHAPKEPGALADNLLGWITSMGWFVCIRCGGRIIARGCSLPAANPVWADKPTDKRCCLCA